MLPKCLLGCLRIRSQPGPLRVQELPAPLTPEPVPVWRRAGQEGGKESVGGHPARGRHRLAPTSSCPHGGSWGRSRRLSPWVAVSAATGTPEPVRRGGGCGGCLAPRPGACARCALWGGGGSWPLRCLHPFLPFSPESIYRRGARRWRKLYRANGHLFQAKRFNRVSGGPPRPPAGPGPGSRPPALRSAQRQAPAAFPATCPR